MVRGASESASSRTRNPSWSPSGLDRPDRPTPCPTGTVPRGLQGAHMRTAAQEPRVVGGRCPRRAGQAARGWGWGWSLPPPHSPRGSRGCREHRDP